MACHVGISVERAALDMSYAMISSYSGIDREVLSVSLLERNDVGSSLYEWGSCQSGLRL